MPFTRRLTFTPANGQGWALRGVLEEQTKARQAAGHRTALGQILYEQNVREEQAEGGRIGLSIGHGGAPRVEVNRLYANFAALDRLGPGPNETWAKRVEGLFASPPVTLIRQVLIPLN